MESPVRHFGSARPYGEFAEKYRKAGFINPIPLPPKEKHPPPKGFTGHGAPDVDLAQLQIWLDCNAKSNIGLRLNTVEIDEEDSISFEKPTGTYEVVAIDVDHHPDDENDPKNGGAQLLWLEKPERLGPLPKTWINSARTNGIAGQRFYLAPAGLAWRGDCGQWGPDIDVISKGYRFAAVFPSFHPLGGQYLWYPPGFAPDGDLDVLGLHEFGPIPFAKRLPLLSNSWIDYLTHGRTIYTIKPQDMDSTNNELKHWAVTNFAEKMGECPKVERVLAKYVAEVDNSHQSHGILTKAHFEFLSLGREGHPGWYFALKEFEKHWRAVVLEREKRSATTANSEIERSVIGALRKIKGDCDTELSMGTQPFAKHDPCLAHPGSVGIVGQSGEPPCWVPFSTNIIQEPFDYEQNDDGNARHLLDLFEGNLRWVANVIGKWLIWDGKQHVVDRSGNLTAGLFREVQRRQLKAARIIVQQAYSSKDQKKINSANKLGVFAVQSGNVIRVNGALTQAKRFKEVEISFEDLDADPMVIGLPSGAIKFKQNGGFDLVENSRDMLITMNTHVPYIPMKDQAGHNDSRVREGYELFWEYMEKFVKSQVTQETWEWLPLGFGQMILGHNNEKIAPFLHGEANTGKSTFQRVLVNSLGDYATWRAPNIFVRKELNPLLAQVLPKRIVCIGEMGRHEIQSEHFKNITGNEPVTCELKGLNEGVTMLPRCTIVSGCNAPPLVPDEDKATRGRFLKIPFRHAVHGAEDLQKRSDEIASKCRIAMLAWLIEGCSASLRRGGIKPYPAEIEMETREFVSRLNDLSAFIDECLELAPTELWEKYALRSENPAKGKPLWRNQSEWCLSVPAMWGRFNIWQQVNVDSRHQISQQTFSRMLSERPGFKQDGQGYEEGKKVRFWVGVKFIENEGISIKNEGS